MSKGAALAQLDDSRAQDSVKDVDISGLDLTQCDISETSTEMLINKLDTTLTFAVWRTKY